MVVIAVTLAACTATSPPASAPSTTTSTTSSQATTTTTQPVVTAKAPVCRAKSIAPASLSAITFLSATTGVGLWSRSSSCGPRIALTRDGGRTWRAVGSKLPAPQADFSPAATPTMVFSSERVGWVNGGGVLVMTRDAGISWTKVPLGGWVTAISRSRSSLWAFVAPCNANPNACSYRLEATTINSTTFHEMALLPSALGNFDPLVVTRLSSERALVAVGQMGPSPTILTTDGGRKWMTVRSCAQSGFVAVGFGTTAPSDAWALCFGGANMSSSLKTIARSADGGKTWTTVAADRSFGGALLPVPSPDGNVFAVPSATTMWMATVESLYGSRDGGKRWFWVHGLSLDGNGAFASFSFVNGRDGWLLAPGSGLWRTTDGRTWHPL
jgi:hypothetical protein